MGSVLVHVFLPEINRQSHEPPHGNGDYEAETRTLACRNVSAAISEVSPTLQRVSPLPTKLPNFCTVVSREDKADVEIAHLPCTWRSRWDIDLSVPAGRDTLQSIGNGRSAFG